MVYGASPICQLLFLFQGREANSVLCIGSWRTRPFFICLTYMPLSYIVLNIFHNAHLIKLGLQKRRVFIKPRCLANIKSWVVSITFHLSVIGKISYFTDLIGEAEYLRRVWSLSRIATIHSWLSENRCFRLCRNIFGVMGRFSVRPKNSLHALLSERREPCPSQSYSL